MTFLPSGSFESREKSSDFSRTGQTMKKSLILSPPAAVVGDGQARPSVGLTAIAGEIAVMIGWRKRTGAGERDGQARPLRSAMAGGLKTKHHKGAVISPKFPILANCQREVNRNA
jgi:hypothetical protein